MAFSCFISVVSGILLLRGLLVVGQIENTTNLAVTNAVSTNDSVTTSLSVTTTIPAAHKYENETNYPSLSNSSACATPKPVCASACSLININGCNACQCPSLHPCVVIKKKLPLGCSECIAVYSTDGCVSDCQCTKWLREQFDELKDKVKRPFNLS